MHAFHCRKLPSNSWSNIWYVMWLKHLFIFFLWSYIGLIVNSQLLLNSTYYYCWYAYLTFSAQKQDREILGSYNDRRSAVVLICTYSVLCRCCVLDAFSWAYSPNCRDTLKNIPIRSGPIDRQHFAADMQPRIEGNNWTNNGVYKKHMFNQSHTYCCEESHCNPLYKNSSNATAHYLPICTEYPRRTRA